jgi:hypothetical protein
MKKCECGVCKRCKHRVHQKKWYDAHKEEAKKYQRTYQKKYYKSHKKDRCEYMRARYHDNQERILLNAKNWKWRIEGKYTEAKRLALKYRFYQQFLMPLHYLPNQEEVYLLMTKMIECPTLTKNQRNILVMFRAGHDALTIAKLTNRQQTTLCGAINGAQVYKEDGEVRFYGGIAKKVIWICQNFQAKDPYLKALIEELEEKKCSMHLGKKICQ